MRVKQEKRENMSKWDNPPDFDTVQAAFINLAVTKSKIKLLENEIAQKAMEIKKANPRKSYLIVDAFPDEHQRLAILESDREKLEGQVKFFDFWKELYKSSVFVNR